MLTTKQHRKKNKKKMKGIGSRNLEEFFLAIKNRLNNETNYLKLLANKIIQTVMRYRNYSKPPNI